MEEVKKRGDMKTVQFKKGAALFVAMGLLTALVGVVSPQYAAAVVPKSEIQYLSSAEATVENVVVTTEGNSIRVEFDYNLRGQATSAYVDAALNNQRSFLPILIDGPGHYNQVITDLPAGDYAIYIVISGNPNTLLGEEGPSNQPLIITFSPAGDVEKNSATEKLIRKSFHKQHQFFIENKPQL